MSPTHGARITVESEKVGAPQRHGEILEIIESGISVRYRVRWDDGRQTTFRPAAGSVVVVSDVAQGSDPQNTTKGAKKREKQERNAAKAASPKNKKGNKKKRKADKK